MKRSELKRLLDREGSLVLATVVLVVLLNVPYGNFVLYPFALFSTWVHELCHGLAAFAVGGSLERLQVFPDTSGLAKSRIPSNRLASAVVSSAGYLGTSVVGAVLLAVRHRSFAASFGVSAIGATMILTVLLWVRNPFGFVAVGAIGLALVVAGRRLEAETCGWLFTFLAATCCLNSITSVRDLFARETVVAGRPVGRSDAHAMADALFLPYWFWGSAWLVTAIALSVMALGAGRRRTSST